MVDSARCGPDLLAHLLGLTRVRYAVADFDDETLKASGLSAADMSRFLSAETGLARRREDSVTENMPGQLAAGALQKELAGVAKGGRKMSDTTLQVRRDRGLHSISARFT